MGGATVDDKADSHYLWDRWYTPLADTVQAVPEVYDAAAIAAGWEEFPLKQCDGLGNDTSSVGVTTNHWQGGS